MMYNDSLRHEQHHLERYKAFCHLYGIADWELCTKLYEIDELICFMPPHPTEQEREALASLIGTTCESGYWDYYKSNNTFELIMQWQEKTGQFRPFLPLKAR